jgi:hypothetical protein
VGFISLAIVPLSLADAEEDTTATQEPQATHEADKSKNGCGDEKELEEGGSTFVRR